MNSSPSLGQVAYFPDYLSGPCSLWLCSQMRIKMLRLASASQMLVRGSLSRPACFASLAQSALSLAQARDLGKHWLFCTRQWAHERWGRDPERSSSVGEMIGNKPHGRRGRTVRIEGPGLTPDAVTFESDVCRGCSCVVRA